MRTVVTGVLSGSSRFLRLGAPAKPPQTSASGSSLPTDEGSVPYRRVGASGRAPIARSAVTSARGTRSAGVATHAAVVVATHAAVVVATVFILADDLDGPGVDGSVAASPSQSTSLAMGTQGL